ncbi:uncharacterized protein PFL1_04061 [Pseudozyma flocculosa PF-1]|uniref:Myb-like domain-containing protein n=1 Tax=Pseudozyma flocculosa PF-1 TaxID=1277687 RepID=A0A061H6Z0_9BASI|nr:uncharacterized protein PFL1_04061 [Pseudozyma flocculosa PF-1]EPQ28234.1 hypothetical protein PFL1_04061 [Pseudozyma flocculosa PF-1]
MPQPPASSSPKASERHRHDDDHHHHHLASTESQRSSEHANKHRKAQRHHAATPNGLVSSDVQAPHQPADKAHKHSKRANTDAAQVGKHKDKATPSASKAKHKKRKRDAAQGDRDAESHEPPVPTTPTRRRSRHRDGIPTLDDEITAEEEAMGLAPSQDDQTGDRDQAADSGRQEEGESTRTSSKRTRTSTKKAKKASKDKDGKRAKGKTKHTVDKTNGRRLERRATAAAVEPAVTMPTGSEADVARRKDSQPEDEASGGARKRQRRGSSGTAKAKELSAKERYQQATWRAPRQAKPKTDRELAELETQRKALAAWARTQSKSHILVHRCFSRQQLGWLTDDIGLEFKRGQFTRQEHQTLVEFVSTYKKRNNMSHDVLLDMVFDAKRTGMVREHRVFFQECAAALVDRANTSVRTHVKTFLHPYYRKGYWTLAELEELKLSFQELGHDFNAIGERVGRVPVSVRHKWFVLEDAQYRANLGPWSDREKAKLRQAVADFQRDRPRTLLIWTDIARQLGDRRHPRAYAAMWHCMRGLNPLTREAEARARELEAQGVPRDQAVVLARREYNRKAHRERRDAVGINYVIDDDEEDVAAQPPSVEDEWRANGLQGAPAMEPDGWEPAVDDLILLQRLRYQAAPKQSLINWAALGFGQWNWPGDVLEAKLERILEARLPSWFRNKRSWHAILEKVYWQVEKENFDPGYDPHHEHEAAAAAKEAATGAREAGGAAPRAQEASDSEVDDVPSDLEEYMDAGEEED